MEDNPTKYYEKQFLLSALNPVCNQSWLSTQGLLKLDVLIMIFKSKNIQKIACLKKASGPKVSTLGNVRSLKRHVASSPSHA